MCGTETEKFGKNDRNWMKWVIRRYGQTFPKMVLAADYLILPSQLLYDYKKVSCAQVMEYILCKFLSIYYIENLITS